MKTYYLVSETTFKSILEDALKFRALESGGVDNWNWYYDSLGDFLKERIREFEPNLDEDNEDFSFVDIVNSELKYFKKIVIESED